MLIVKFLQMVLLLILSSKSTIADKEPQHSKTTTYIIQMDPSSKPSSFNDELDWYASSLISASDSAEMLYTYKHAIQGFSTRLTIEEADLLREQSGVLSATPETVYQLHTTRTPQFLGLEKDCSTNYLPASEKESEVIIGVIDTGVWPELRSFDDAGLGPIPSRWKGKCVIEKDFNASSCNRKLVGARYFLKGYEAALGRPINETEESRSPRDTEGHGTHTSSTAGGSIVANASFFGYASGKARGMTPKARLAIYKACWKIDCSETDIIAAIDAAIEDGVNIISMSLGGDPTDYYRDIMAIGSFKATARGIFVSASAGNGGPGPKSLSNIAPWITSVGAGTIDRDFPGYVSLGNGKNYTGASLSTAKPLPGSLLPLVYAGNVSSPPSVFCEEHTLIPSKVKGKIVICEEGLLGSVNKGLQVNKSGGLGMILINNKEQGEELFASKHLIPAASLGYKAGNELKKYAFSDSNPTATITFGFTRLHVQPSPMVAAFSSRGPNPVTPGILKPDLIAPGFNILAGWTQAAGPAGSDYDTRRVDFNIISGTSMSCPHVSGLAAFLKGAHPDWSPAIIRSALMTTAYTTYKNGTTLLDVATGKPATPFDFGAGHVDPVAALDPGLVYDTTVDDYLNFLCALNYTSRKIKQVTGQDFACDSSKEYRVEDLNYPSFAVNMKRASGRGVARGKPVTVKYTRILTNLGAPGTYKVSVSSKCSSVKIEVEPKILCFSKMYEKQNFTVTFTSASMPHGTTSFGHLEWSGGKHKVVSPIALSWT